MAMSKKILGLSPLSALLVGVGAYMILKPKAAAVGAIDLKTVLLQGFAADQVIVEKSALADLCKIAASQQTNPIPAQWVLDLYKISGPTADATRIAAALNSIVVGLALPSSMIPSNLAFFKNQAIGYAKTSLGIA